MATRPSSTAPEPAAGPVRFTATELFWILLAAMLIMFLANGALIYFATDSTTDFRDLIDLLC